MEVAEGIHRVESSLGVRFMAQYILTGTDRTLLVDTGLPHTPAEALGPYLEGLGLGLAALDDVLISHADLDHSGGNRALRDLHPQARFACHELDRRWIESNDAMVNENYLWHEPYGFDEPDEAGRAALKALCGGDAPIDEGLQGGETIRLEHDWRVEVLHLPGHTLGHIGLWDPRSRAAIVIDTPQVVPSAIRSQRASVLEAAQAHPQVTIGEAGAFSASDARVMWTYAGSSTTW